MRTCRTRTAMLTAGLLAALAGAAATAQSGRDLSTLTVPEDRLPAGCQLKPVVPRPPMPPQGGVVVVSGDSEPNPLISRERRVATHIKWLVDGAPPVPDGPPLMPRAAAAWSSRWAEDVVEAYRATYRRADESLVTVAAMQFDDERLATAEPPFGARRVARGTTSRIVLGPTVVQISADETSDCFRAIETYLRSLR